jgi:hypothetical protein
VQARTTTPAHDRRTKGGPVRSSNALSLWAHKNCVKVASQIRRRTAGVRTSYICPDRDSVGLGRRLVSLARLWSGVFWQHCLAEIAAWHSTYDRFSAAAMSAEGRERGNVVGNGDAGLCPQYMRKEPRRWPEVGYVAHRDQ